MNFTTTTFGNYLGKPAHKMLGDAPFSSWHFERSSEDDGSQPRIDYVSEENGLDVLCDEDDRIATIFLHASEERRFNGDLDDLPLSSTRDLVLLRLGVPDKSFSRFSHSILGDIGPRDRFVRTGFSIQVQYRVDSDVIELVTLMRPDVVP